MSSEIDFQKLLESLCYGSCCGWLEAASLRYAISAPHGLNQNVLSDYAISRVLVWSHQFSIAIVTFALRDYFGKVASTSQQSFQINVLPKFL